MGFLSVNFLLLSCFRHYSSQKNMFLCHYQYLVSDVFSVVIGFFLCFVGFVGRSEGEDTLIEEPLLNGDSSVGNNLESNKSK